MSVRIVVAPPIVSHAPRYRTRLLSSSIRRTLKANASVTARGKPSGTATTTTVTPVMTNRRYCSAICAHCGLEPATAPPTAPPTAPSAKTPLRNNRWVYEADMVNATKAPA